MRIVCIKLMLVDDGMHDACMQIQMHAACGHGRFRVPEAIEREGGNKA